MNQEKKTAQDLPTVRKPLDEFFAGAAFECSPPASALPLPDDLLQVKTEPTKNERKRDYQK